jgi:hypothetical protein
MRQLTFAGFLKQYLQSLSRSGTNSIYKLTAEAASFNPRLREPLFLFSLFGKKEKVLLAAAKTTELHKEYASMFERFSKQSMEQALRDNDYSLPNNYTKVYRSYLSFKNKNTNDAHIKKLMRDRIIRTQREKKVSNYRIYTDLNLNHGNINAYIKHCDCTKVSLNTARRIIEYINKVQANA